MRAIKFRAWDGENIVDIYQIQTRTSEVAVYHLKGGYSNGKRLTKIDNPILMQYTGLKDKNGKEIYEGDIISIFDEMSKILCYFGWHEWRDIPLHPNFYISFDRKCSRCGKKQHLEIDWLTGMRHWS